MIDAARDLGLSEGVGGWVFAGYGRGIGMKHVSLLCVLHVASTTLMFRIAFAHRFYTPSCGRGAS